MKLPGILLGRLLDGVDIAFEAISAIVRVLVRGAFAPDARSRRGPRFAALDAKDVLVQEIELNAADADQARKAVLVDPERRLPISLDSARFDIAGPLDDGSRPRPRPERNFLLAMARNDALARHRENMPKARAGQVEAFVFSPLDHSHIAFAFTDAPGARRRRFRRGVTALAFVVLVATAYDFSRAWSGAIETALAQTESERVQAERRLRLAERNLERAREAQLTLSEAPATPIAAVQDQLSLLAFRLPPDSELSELDLRDGALNLQGSSAAPELLELELRRTFEGQTIQFSSATEAERATFEASIRVSSRSDGIGGP
jgi:hypothetical protein